MTTEVEDLYALPLDEFTPARDELVRRLRKEGDRDAAVKVKQLRKPSVAAWALNQVRRNESKQTDQLLEAGRRLREAQEKLLAGGDREALERAAADERELVGELVRKAEAELAEAGRPVTAAVQEKLRATLHAAAADPEAREALAEGRLVTDHQVRSLGTVTEPSSAPARGGRKKQAAPARERKTGQLEKKLERARERRDKLDQEQAEAKTRLREARHAATRAAAELERAEAADERARRRAKEAADAVTELERELRYG